MITIKDQETLTQEQARMLCDAHEIFSLLGNDEEVELLEANNPEFLEAYFALHRIAAGKAIDGGNGCEA